MLPVVWLESARQDISRITAYIADSNPNAAYKLNAKLRDDAEILGAWAVEGVEAKIGPSDGQVFDDFAAEYLDIWQTSGKNRPLRSICSRRSFCRPGS